MLKLNHNSLRRIQLHAMRTYPEECCGVLLGKGEGNARIVRSVVELRNQNDANRERRFLVTPEDYRKAEEHAQREGIEILGFYHSHPDHPAAPSQFDLEHALPNWSYVIISVDDGVPGAMASWSLQHDRSHFEQEKIEAYH